MILMVLETLEGGYVDTYVFDCAADLGNMEESNIKQVCDKDPFMPTFNLVRPPEIRINPYTGKPMPMEYINY